MVIYRYLLGCFFVRALTLGRAHYNNTLLSPVRLPVQSKARPTLMAVSRQDLEQSVSIFARQFAGQLCRYSESTSAAATEQLGIRHIQQEPKDLMEACLDVFHAGDISVRVQN